MREAFQKLTIGLSAPLFGLAVSVGTTKEWLQLLSLAGGLVICALTIVSICFTIDRKLRRRRLEIKLNKMIDMDEKTTTI